MQDEERQPLLSAETLGAAAANRFGVTADELMRLVDPKSPAVLQQLGGIDSIAKKLRVDLSTGISGSCIIERQQAFGDNVLPPAESTTFWQLLIAAYDDKTLGNYK